MPSWFAGFAVKGRGDCLGGGFGGELDLTALVIWLLFWKMVVPLTAHRLNSTVAMVHYFLFWNYCDVCTAGSLGFGTASQRVSYAVVGPGLESILECAAMVFLMLILSAA